MREVGIDLSERKPKKLLREMQLHADWAVTMGCDDACPYVPDDRRGVEHPDPAGRPLDEVRAIRDSIEAHVRELIDTKLDAIRSDRTAHQLRLAQLLPELAAEFESRHSAEDIRACADAILARFDDAPVRSLRPARSRCARRASACARRPATCWRWRDESGEPDRDPTRKLR